MIKYFTSTSYAVTSITDTEHQVLSLIVFNLHYSLFIYNLLLYYLLLYPPYEVRTGDTMV